MFRVWKLAENIKKIRVAKGMSQTTLATMLMVTPQSVSKWESGNSVPDIENLCRLSEILGVSLDSLLGHIKEGKKVMVGVDGGGSKTEFLMFDEDGTILKCICLGACNPNAIGIEKSADLLKNGVDQLLQTNPNICGIYIGASGFLTDGNGEKIKAFLMKHFPQIKIQCKTDIMNVIGNCGDIENCVPVICGTGAIVFAKEKEKFTMQTGWNYLLSKQGSGFDVGRDAICAALEEREGRGRKTCITTLVEKRIDGLATDLIAEVYRRDSTFIASFAPIVFEAYEQGDSVAAEIVQTNTKRVAEVINHTADHYRCDRTVILSGGLISNPVYAESLIGQLHPDLKVIIPREPQVIGACRLCAEMCDVSGEKLNEDFVKQYFERR